MAVKWDENAEKLILVSHRIWKPTPGKPLDLENTVEEDLRDLNEQNQVAAILTDPYQLHRSIMTLQAAGIPICEFAQTQANCTLMGQTLFDLLSGQNLVLYPSDGAGLQPEADPHRRPNLTGQGKVAGNSYAL